LSDDTASGKAARSSWERFIKKVFAADPLLCPDCGGAMRIITFIEDRHVVRAILPPLSLWDEARPPRSRRARRRVHPPSSSTCPAWSDLHRPAARQCAVKLVACRFIWLSGALQNELRPIDPGLRLVAT